MEPGDEANPLGGSFSKHLSMNKQFVFPELPLPYSSRSVTAGYHTAKLYQDAEGHRPLSSQPPPTSHLSLFPHCIPPGDSTVRSYVIVISYMYNVHCMFVLEILWMIMSSQVRTPLCAKWYAQQVFGGVRVHHGLTIYNLLELNSYGIYVCTEAKLCVYNLVCALLYFWTSFFLIWG